MRRPTALLLAYDGAPFKGWQAQSGQPTVQGAIEQALSTALHVKVQVFGAARTDAGVHAEGQVCHFVKEKIDGTRALVELMEALPALLPEGLRLRSAALAHQSFHARSSSVGKRYRYRFSWGTLVAQAGPRTFALGADARPEWDRAREALAALLELTELPGLSSPSSDKRPAPGLGGFRLEVEEAEEGAGAAADVDANADADANATPAPESLATLELWGPAFRKHQVRNLAGHLAAIALGLAKPESLQELAQRKRPWMGAQAPARGLTLMEVVYPLGVGPFGLSSWQQRGEINARLETPQDE
jgi:tRNA pseudouridine38-40 synthase